MTKRIVGIAWAEGGGEVLTPFILIITQRNMSIKVSFVTQTVGNLKLLISQYLWHQDLRIIGYVMITWRHGGHSGAQFFKKNFSLASLVMYISMAAIELCIWVPLFLVSMWHYHQYTDQLSCWNQEKMSITNWVCLNKLRNLSLRSRQETDTGTICLIFMIYWSV